MIAWKMCFDRLTGLVAPESAADATFVARVMHRLHGAEVATRHPDFRSRRPIHLAIGVAVCLAVVLVVWRTTAAHRSIPVVAVAGNEEKNPVETKDTKNKTVPTIRPIEAPPVVRTSTWSDVAETVVLEGNVPVRKLLYREFERVELLDPQGNLESRLIVPTRVMFLATKEQY